MTETRDVYWDLHECAWVPSPRQEPAADASVAIPEQSTVVAARQEADVRSG